MIEFPSHRAAAFCGAMAMLLSTLVYDYAVKHHANGLSVFAFSGLAFFLPMIFSTVDFADLKEILKEIRTIGIFNIFQLRYTHYEEVTRFWRQFRDRMALYCAFGIISILVMSVASEVIGRKP